MYGVCTCASAYTCKLLKLDYKIFPEAFDIVMQMFMNEKNMPTIYVMCAVASTMPKCPQPKWMVKSIVEMQKPTNEQKKLRYEICRWNILLHTRTSTCTTCTMWFNWANGTYGMLCSVLHCPVCTLCDAYRCYVAAAVAATAITRNVIL